METLEKKPFAFQVDPIFQAYFMVATHHPCPTIESVLTKYDEVVRFKVNDLHDRFNIRGYHDIHQMTKDSPHYDEIIGMKPTLEKKELLDVFLFYHVMHKDNYGFYHNLPTKEVW